MMFMGMMVKSMSPLSKSRPKLPLGYRPMREGLSKRGKKAEHACVNTVSESQREIVPEAGMAEAVTPEEGGWIIDIETGKPRTTGFTAIGRMATGEANLLQTPEGILLERIATGKQKGWWKTIVGETEIVAKTPEKVVEIATERGLILPKALLIAEAVIPKASELPTKADYGQRK